jgi:hypothetical protein
MGNYQFYENSTSAAVRATEILPLTDSSTTFLPLKIFIFFILIILPISYFIIKKIFFPLRCPHCYSRIHKKATFCKHCRKDI